MWSNAYFLLYRICYIELWFFDGGIDFQTTYLHQVLQYTNLMNVRKVGKRLNVMDDDFRFWFKDSKCQICKVLLSLGKAYIILRNSSKKYIK